MFYAVFLFSPVLSCPRILGPTVDINLVLEVRESTTHLNLLFEGRVFRIFKIVLTPKQDKTSQIHTFPKGFCGYFYLCISGASILGDVKFLLLERFEALWKKAVSPTLEMEGFAIFQMSLRHREKGVFLKQCFSPIIFNTLPSSPN